MQRRVFTLVAAAIAFSAMASCGTENKSDSAGHTTTQLAAATAAPTATPPVLVRPTTIPFNDGMDEMDPDPVGTPRIRPTRTPFVDDMEMMDEVTVRRGTPTSTPDRTGAETRIPEPGSIAPDFTLPSGNSPDVTLSEMTRNQPVVLVFYRAYW